MHLAELAGRLLLAAVPEFLGALAAALAVTGAAWARRRLSGRRRGDGGR
ncbi:hypothetical protein [Streptomyces sp. NPDC091371]